MSTATLDILLSRTRRRWRRIHNRHDFWRGAWMLLLFCAFMVVLDVFWRLAPEVRSGLGWTLAALVAVSLSRYVWLKFHRRRPEDYFASVLEQHNPELASRLINAVQFRKRLEDGAQEGVSADLMQEEIKRGETAAEAVDARAALDPRPGRREFLVFAGLAAIVLIGHLLQPGVLNAVAPRFTDPWGDHPPFSLTSYQVDPGSASVVYGEALIVKTKTAGPPVESLALCYEPEGGGAPLREVPMFRTPEGEFSQQVEALTEPMRYHVRSEKGWSRTYQVSIDKSPRIKTIEAVRVHPAYTRLKDDASRLRLSPAEATANNGYATHSASPFLAGVKDTRVTLHVESNRPLAAGEIKSTSGLWGAPPIRLRPEPGQSNKLFGEMPITASGEFILSVTDAEGHSGHDRVQLRAVRIPDLEPTVELAQPGPYSMAIPSATLPIDVSADDDFGVSEIVVRHRAGDNEWKEIRAEMDETIRDFGDLSTEIPLSGMNLVPGDEIELYASAKDNDPEGGKVARTPIHKVRIISEEQYRQMAAEQRTAEELIQEYTAVLDELDDLLKTQEDLQNRTEELAREIENATDSANVGLTQEQAETAQEIAKEQKELASRTEEFARDLMKRDNQLGATPLDREMNKQLAEMGRQMASEAQRPMERAGQQMEQAQGNQPSLALAGSALNQQKAADALRSLKEGAAGQMEEEIKQIEQVAELFNDVNRFFQVFEEQKRLAAEMQALKSETDPDAGKQHEMARLSQEESALAQRLEELRKDFARHGEQVKENYPKLAAKAGEIAQDLEDLATAGKMEKSAESLAAAQPIPGHQRAMEAQADLESMMEKAGECEKCLSDDLNLSLSLAQGNSQGSGNGMGAAGSMGMTASMADTLRQLMQNQMRKSQMPGSQSYSLYGPEGNEGGQTSPHSKRQNKKKQELHVETPEGLAPAMLGKLEPLDQKEQEILMGMKERYPELYKELIAAYYLRLAEESEK